MYEVCPEGIQSCGMKYRDIFLRKIQDTRNIVHETMMPQSPSKQTPWDLTQFSQLLSAALLYFPESHQWSEISLLSKVILVLGKARSHRVPNLGCRGAESPGWSDVLSKKLHKMWCMSGCVVMMNHQLPLAVALRINWIVSTEECSNLTQNLMQICCSACSVIVNVTATQYICSPNSIYRPHWLVQWSCHCSYTCIPVHSLWLPGYINVVQSVLWY